MSILNKKNSDNSMKELSEAETDVGTNKIRSKYLGYLVEDIRNFQQQDNRMTRE